jgi:hypothetical protein
MGLVDWVGLGNVGLLLSASLLAASLCRIARLSGRDVENGRREVALWGSIPIASNSGVPARLDTGRVPQAARDRVDFVQPRGGSRRPLLRRLPRDAERISVRWGLRGKPEVRTGSKFPPVRAEVPVACDRSRKAKRRRAGYNDCSGEANRMGGGNLSIQTAASTTLDDDETRHASAELEVRDLRTGRMDPRPQVLVGSVAVDPSLRE